MYSQYHPLNNGRRIALNYLYERTGSKPISIKGRNLQNLLLDAELKCVVTLIWQSYGG